jgi:hypothetical protein
VTQDRAPVDTVMNLPVPYGIELLLYATTGSRGLCPVETGTWVRENNIVNGEL